MTALNKWLNLSICIVAILFLLYYSYKSFLSAKKNHELSMLSPSISHTKESIIKSIASTLAITLLNPHVYLDTVVVVGGYASSLSLQSKLYFMFGASLSSFIWFFSLGYLSTYLSRFFNKPKTWVFFDIFVSLFMLVLAISLMFYIYVEIL